MIRSVLTASAALALAACAQPAPQAPEAPEAPAAPPAAVAITAPAGAYGLDKGHASMIVRVNHLGLSNYAMRFTDFDATLNFDSANPTASSVTATINPKSIETDYPGDYKGTHPDSKFKSWDEDLAMNAQWLAAGEHPEISFKSTGLTLTGERTGTMTGDLTFRGVTAPVTLEVTFNGEATPPWLEGRSAIGFTARGGFDRSAFGVTNLVGPVSDRVSIEIEAEFWQQAAG